MTTHPADPGSPHLPPMRTIGELRAALTMGYGFPGDADDFESELAREINHAGPADLGGIVRLVEEFRGHLRIRRSASLEGAVLGGGFGDWNDKIRSGRVQPDRPAPTRDEIAEVLRPMCREWGYV